MKRRLAYLLIFLCCSLAACFPKWIGCQKLQAQTCLPDGIQFTSQASLDAFATDYPGCTQILGSVLIEESTSGDIEDLQGLSALSSIGQFLEISGNTRLQNLAGLDNLLEVGENLSISGNAALLDVKALAKLSYIGQSLRVDANHALKNLSGLQAIQLIFQDLKVTNNNALHNLSGLDSLVQIGGQLNILSNASLNNLAGLSRLTSIGNILEISDNPNLESLDALQQLTTIGFDFIVDQNPRLSSLHGLQSLQAIDGFLQIINNERLTNVSALIGLRKIDGLLQVYNNPVLANLQGLDSIAASSINNLALLANVSLAICDATSICQYLEDPQASFSIAGNISGCASRDQILASCEGNGLNGRPGTSSDILLFPNPTFGEVWIKGRNMKAAKVQVVDTSGKLVWQTTVEEQRFELELIPAGFYSVHIWNERNSFRKPLVLIE